MTAPLRNPVFGRNFADPFVLEVGDQQWLAFATNGEFGNVSTLTSADLQTWEPIDTALPALPGWAGPTPDGRLRVWAPEVCQRPDGAWLMYYSTFDTRSGRMAVSVAVADEPAGPYVDASPAPLLAQAQEGGSIDASPFADTDGRMYLYWKNDGNAIGRDTWIQVAALTASGQLDPSQPARRLFRADLPWEGELVEAPFGWRRGQRYHLFYSANAFASADYAVGHAVGPSPTGPFVKDPEPLLVSGNGAAGPGHCMLFDTDGGTWMAYHAWLEGAVRAEPGRTMWLSPVRFDGDTAVVDGP